MEKLNFIKCLVCFSNGAIKPKYKKNYKVISRTICFENVIVFIRIFIQVLTEAS